LNLQYLFDSLSLRLPHHAVSLSSLASLPVGRAPVVLPTVRLRGTGHLGATRPHGEVKENGRASPGSIPVLERVDRPQRGLGHSPSILRRARRLIGTAFALRMRMNAGKWSWLCRCLFGCAEMLILILFWSVTLTNYQVFSLQLIFL